MKQFFPVTAFLFFLSIMFHQGSKAQGYSMQDSALIFNLLDKADAEDMAGNLDKALHFAKDALQTSKNMRMLRGEGFAHLKIADLKLKKEGTLGAAKLFAEPIRIGSLLMDSFLLGLSYHQQGQFYRDQSQFNEADLSYSKALIYYEGKKLKNYVALIFNDKGFIYERMGEYEKAAGMYVNAIRNFEAEKNLKETANTTGNLGITYYRMGNKEEAIRQFKASAQIRETIGDVKGMAAIYGNLVTAYTSLAQPDSANKYQQLAIVNAEKTGVRNTLAQTYANAAVLLSRQNKFQEALDFEHKAVVLYVEMGDKVKLANRFIVMAGLFDKLQDSIQAEEYFQKALIIASELQNKPVFQTLYSVKSSFYGTHHNYKEAFAYYKLFYTYKDSLLNEKTAANIAELQTKYETEKKDNEITRLNTDQKINQLEIEKQKAVIAGNTQEAKRKEIQIQILKQQQELRDAEIIRQKEELEKQTLLNKNNEQQLLLSVQELQISENEKKLRTRQLDKERLIRNGFIAGIVLLLVVGGLLFNRYQLRKRLDEQKALLSMRNKISKDLHDDIGSTLTSINILSNVAEKVIEQDPLQARKIIHDITAQSKNIQQNMSDIVWAIRPDNDKVENLAARMREHIGNTLEPKQIATTLEADDEAMQLSVPMQHRKEILLIYKEAINNILKHSEATKATIQLGAENHLFKMNIRDNGKWKQKKYSSGTGTYSMKQRAESLGGTLHISGTDDGTNVSLTMPIP